MTATTAPQIVKANVETTPIAIEVPVGSRMCISLARQGSLGTWAGDRGPSPSPRRERRMVRDLHLGVGTGACQVERPLRPDVRDVPAVDGGVRVGDRAARDEAPDHV